MHACRSTLEDPTDGNELEYVQECVRTGWISSQGRFVTRFEAMMAEFHGVPHALAVSNGTVALHLALAALGVGPGDEVIVPDFTFAASANAVIHAGATPVFVDVDRRTWNIDVAAAERALTPRTRAIMPVHLYGHPCDMDALMSFARSRDLLVVEDCAEAFGARYRGKRIGSFGDAACFSFFGNKTLTTGEGGVILFQHAARHERAAMLRDHGMSKERRYWHLEVGYNYRLTNLQAAVGVAQMERAEHILARKNAIGDRYTAALSRVDGIKLPPRVPPSEPVCWLYTVLVDDAVGITRDDLASRLLLNGVESRPVFAPLHLMPAFSEFSHGDFPESERLAARGLSLPSAATLTDKDVEHVCATIRSVLEVRQMLVAERTTPGPSRQEAPSLRS